MSASLVGSEMCIRDRGLPLPPPVGGCLAGVGAARRPRGSWGGAGAEFCALRGWLPCLGLSVFLWPGRSLAVSWRAHGWVLTAAR
eukprot:1721030-Alexandrium_andersonii.AAC.1